MCKGRKQLEHLDGGDGRIDVLGHHVTTVQHAARHVLACNEDGVVVVVSVVVVFFVVSLVFVLNNIGCWCFWCWLW